MKSSSPYLLVLIAAAAHAQLPTRPADVLRIGPGITPPRLLHKIEPAYSADARSNRIQGTVIFELVVDEKGRATDIAVLSPLGFGLDENAERAIGKWEFAPGKKDGKPVKILATVEVNFHFPEIGFDERTEKHRSSFNVDIQNLNRAGARPADIERAVRSIQELSTQEFPPAMYTVGIWETKGDRVPQNPDDGLALIQKAASKNYGPALYEIGRRRIEGKDLPADPDKGLGQVRQAAMLGSPQAQFYLGNRYEKGDGVPQELDRARRYFRLCAVKGVTPCQYRLGKMLLDAPNRPERDYVQAVALFELASEQGLEEAKDVAAAEAAKLTPAQTDWVAKVKMQLVHQ